VIYKRCGETGKRVIRAVRSQEFHDYNARLRRRQDNRSDDDLFLRQLRAEVPGGGYAVVVGNDSFYQSFVRKVVEQSSKIKVGYGLDESVQMGPVRDPEKKARILKYIDIGVKARSQTDP